MTPSDSSEMSCKEDCLRSFFEVADVMLIALAADETIVEVNAIACEVLGARREGLVRRNWFDDFLPETERERVRKVFHDALSGRTELPERYVNQIVSLDGSTRTIAWRNQLRRGAHGREIASFSSGSDITQKLAAERALRESERRYREIVETTDEGVWVIDLEGGTIFANERMAQMLGCTVEQLLAGSLFDYIDDAERETARRNIQRRREGVRESHRFTFRRADGIPLHTWITTNPIYDDDGHVVGALGMVTDVTDRVRAEEEREQMRARMASLQRLESLGVLAGGVAHDFNNLLVGVLGNADLARHAEGLPAFAGERLDAVIEAAERASRLTRQLLDYAGRGEGRAQPIDLRTQVESIVGLVRDALTSGVQVEVQQDDALPLWVDADPDRLQQVVMNLVTNAAESYAGKPGSVVIRVLREAVPTPVGSVAVIEPTLEDRKLAGLEVRDFGCGMGSSTLERMFEPFYSTKGVGRGLGLSSALGFVRAQRGGLAVRSAPGAGTCMWIGLPAARAPEAPTVEPRPSDSAPASILVIDDEPMVRDLAATALRSRAHSVELASSGHEAIELSRTGRHYDLLVVDVSMPDLDGEATLRQLRERGHREPALICSGYLEHGILERFERLGPVRFLHKPYRPDKLLAAVAELRAADLL